MNTADDSFLSRGVSRSLLLLAVLSLAFLGAMSACGPGDRSNADVDKAGDAMTPRTDQPVCGLVDVDLVRKITGPGKIGTRGAGATDRASRKLEPSNCTVQDADKSQTVLQVTIGEVADPDQWRQKLEAEAAESNYCTKRYNVDLGHGYACTYDSGVFVDGAGVNTVVGDRLIRVTVHHWPDATPHQRLELAEAIAQNADRNLTRYDKHHTG